MNDNKNVFPEGIYFNRPSESSPDFVKGKISIDLERFYAWAKKLENTGKYIRLDVLVSKDKVDDNGKKQLYLKVNDYNPMQPKPEFGEVDPKIVPANKGFKAPDISNEDF